MLDSTGDLAFDVRLIPEFDGSSSQCVSDWFLKLELVCRLRRVVDVAAVIPLRLAGGALTVYLELPDEDKRSVEKVKEALLAAFSMEPLEACDNFSSRKLRNGETPDVFLSELRKLASLFGGISEKGMMCAFISGLPGSVRQILRASLRLQELSLSQDPKVRKGTSAYIDDILVNGDVVSTRQVQDLLARFGLASKAPENVADGARVLGLRVWVEHGKLAWRRGVEIPSLPTRLTRRSIFAYCGQLTGHFPVCGWLRVARALAKRMANGATTGWDDPVSSPELEAILCKIDGRVRLHDPARGRWDVSGDKGKVWVDASGIAIGAAGEICGTIVEDATWLRPDDARHINMAELDAVIRGLNLALAWELKDVEVMTDSATVQRWVLESISGKARLKTKAVGELLIRRRIETIRSLVNEYSIQASVTLVKSSENKADALTRVPKEWLKPQEAIIRTAYAMAADGSAEQRIAEIHHTAGHPGVRRTHYFVRQSDCQITRRQRLAMDVTHVGGYSYLTLIDSGPSSADVADQLELVFLERGAPEEILADNDTAFRSRLLEQLAERWNVRVIVARKECSVPEAVHLYNITPRDDCNAETAPANTLYAYRIRLRGIDAHAPDGHPQSQYKVGDHVWIMPLRLKAYLVMCGTFAYVDNPKKLPISRTAQRTAEVLRQ
ncbi:hypothetical protein M513_12047 [Trichuris suis]|uniref:Uncharacterized protein n=1 Tax=Trichuris suis TaxID=68888 RepID=A0A085LQ13_9BILA|nr:hypothetical protein M513_12047 [Trichuris suis]